MKKIILALMVLALALPGIALAEEPAPVLKVGDTVASLPVNDLNGQPVDLVKAFDTPKAIISFMNTSCTACLSELRMSSGLAKEKGVALLVVSVDMAADRLGVYMERNRLDTGTMYHDPAFAIPPKFGFNFTPGLVVIDKAGKILYLKGGWNDKHAGAIKEQIAGLL